MNDPMKHRDTEIAAGRRRTLPGVLRVPVVNLV